MITSRPLKDKDHTLQILENYFWNDFFSDIIFTLETWEDNKYSIATELSLDVVIDDSPHHIESYQKYFSGKICIFHQMWNRHIREDNKNIFRIHNWNDFQLLLPRLIFTMFTVQLPSSAAHNIRSTSSSSQRQQPV